MSALSISRAWDETRARLASDGRLLTTVALAMIALPSAVSALVNPSGGLAGNTAFSGAGVVSLIMSLIALVGQLAIIRLAIGPSVSVGGAIGHAARRALPYIAAFILLLIALVILGIPLGLVLMALGVSFEAGGGVPAAAWIPIILFIGVVLYAAARMLMISAVASAEAAGPVKILKRSWELTRGHAGKLLGFLLLFLIAALIVLGAVAIMVGLLARALFGELEPFSAGALLLGLVQGVVSAIATTIFAVMIARIYLQLNGPAAGAAEVTVPHSGT